MGRRRGAGRSTPGACETPSAWPIAEPGDGRSAYRDLGWEQYEVAVEYDGQGHHTSPSDQRRELTAATSSGDGAGG
ncbi:hypothetical protein E1267_07820 [Nonomuraea longispora]|uniref:DUF559 domain-containing protein n=1 Tax=Nonomuraea longispora TaxID=1848320 RepID=A0A4R4NJD6_9ACTN|nr:hypothetical protein [Nonomuraea longispora]TDC09209.1 hypothetical protein E1267_07820 [Nonomuraea longispora]